MNWLTNFVRPKLQALTRKAEPPDNLWEKCPGCGQMIFHRELDANLRVCPHCNHHFRIGWKRRLELLFDEGKFERIDLPKSLPDPLKFRDIKRYTDRLKDAQSKTGEADAIVVAHGTLGGDPTVIAAFNFEFMGGSMGMAVGDGLIAAARLAVSNHAALIAIPASGGARASFAMLGDVAISEPGAIIGFAGKRVIEDTIREKLPEGFQRAEYLLEHGMIDMVVPRGELRATLARVIALLRNHSPMPMGDGGAGDGPRLAEAGAETVPAPIAAAG